MFRNDRQAVHGNSQKLSTDKVTYMIGLPFTGSVWGCSYIVGVSSGHWVHFTFNMFRTGLCCLYFALLAFMNITECWEKTYRVETICKCGKLGFSFFFHVVDDDWRQHHGQCSCISKPESMVECFPWYDTHSFGLIKGWESWITYQSVREMAKFSGIKLETWKHCSKGTTVVLVSCVQHQDSKIIENCCFIIRKQALKCAFRCKNVCYWDRTIKGASAIYF